MKETMWTFAFAVFGTAIISAAVTAAAIKVAGEINNPPSAEEYFTDIDKAREVYVACLRDGNPVKVVDVLEGWQVTCFD